MSTRTAVIVGCDRTMTVEDMEKLSAHLVSEYPGVEFTLVNGVSSVTFQFTPKATP